MHTGSKTVTVSVSIESDLLAALDHVCELRDVGRSDFCRRAVKSAIALELSKDPSFWSRVYFGCSEKSCHGKIF